jgi:hypothetical protein
MDARQKPARRPPPPPVETFSPSSGDLDALPPRVAEIRERILVATRSGDIERLRPAIEWNETLPLFARGDDRPRSFATVIDFLKRYSFDGHGREILALLQAAFENDYVKSTRGSTVSYIWPHFAAVQKPDPTADERLAMYRCVRFANLALTNDIGLPLMQRAGIGEDGTWHYFLAG